jgi:hypothetical protein
MREHERRIHTVERPMAARRSAVDTAGDGVADP